jgi:ribosomal protein S18 acetylase RimI-like enzyme
MDENTNEPIGCVVGKLDYTSSTGDAASAVEDNEAVIAENGGEPSRVVMESTAAASAEPIVNEEQQAEPSELADPEPIGNEPLAAETTLEPAETIITTGYIGMLAVSKEYRRRGIGAALVREVLHRMCHRFDCTSVILETEVTNTSAQYLYQRCFGFIREELLVRYYLNWNDAFRLRLWFDKTSKPISLVGPEESSPVES